MKKVNFSVILSLAIILISACSKQGARENCSYDLIAVQSDDKWGYIDKEGKYVINPQFKEAFLFSDGLALVQSQDNKYGYIGEDGKFVINPTYKSGTVFSEGLAFVTIENGFPTCIDKKGEIKFELKEVIEASIFQEGLACVKIKDKWGFIDNTGKVVINPQFDEASEFTEGLAAVGTKKSKDSEELQWGFIDKEGKIVINPQFKKAFSFKDGKALVNDGKKFGYIDTKGLYVINPQFDEAKWFNDGIAAVKQGDSWGYINEEGKIIINPQFEKATSFKNGIAAVRSGKENWGYIDKEGKYLINPQFKDAAKFYADFAPVLSGDKYGFVDKAGKFIVNPQFTNVNLNSYWNQLDSWPILYKYIYSDYFDITEVSKAILDKAKGNNFGNVSASSSLANLVDLPENKNKLKEYSKYSIINSNEEILNSDINIQSVVYEFTSPVYKMVTDYYYGYSMGTQKKYDYDAKIESVSYNLQLNQFGKGNGKAFVLAEGLQKELLKKYGGTDKSNSKPVNEPTKEEIEASEKAKMDSIAAAEEAVKAAEMAAGITTTNESNNSSSPKYDYKTLYVYSNTFDFQISSDGVNNVTLKVIFKNKSNS